MDLNILSGCLSKTPWKGILKRGTFDTRHGNATASAFLILVVSSEVLERNFGKGRGQLLPTFWVYTVLATDPADSYKTLKRNLCKKES